MQTNIVRGGLLATVALVALSVSLPVSAHRVYGASPHRHRAVTSEESERKVADPGRTADGRCIDCAIAEGSSYELHQRHDWPADPPIFMDKSHHHTELTRYEWRNTYHWPDEAFNVLQQQNKNGFCTRIETYVGLTKVFMDRNAELKGRLPNLYARLDGLSTVIDDAAKGSYAGNVTSGILGFVTGGWLYGGMNGANQVGDALKTHAWQKMSHVQNDIERFDLDMRDNHLDESELWLYENGDYLGVMGGYCIDILGITPPPAQVASPPPSSYYSAPPASGPYMSQASPNGAPVAPVSYQAQSQQQQYYQQRPGYYVRTESGDLAYVVR